MINTQANKRQTNLHTAKIKYYLKDWNKLITVFGGAPEIPIFHYYTINTDGTKQSHHDFNPIKL